MPPLGANGAIVALLGDAGAGSAGAWGACYAPPLLRTPPGEDSSFGLDGPTETARNPASIAMLKFKV